MLNILIVESNMDYAVKLMYYINNNNKNVRVYNITKKVEDTLRILNDKNNIDIILLDYDIFFNTDNDILDKILDKNKYKKSIIILSGRQKEVINNQTIYTTLYKDTSIMEIVKKINELAIYKELTKSENIYNKKIINELLYLGYDISLKGTQYLIEATKYMLLNKNKRIDKLEKNVYPKIAEMYDDSVHNIKCRINSATTTMYYNCDGKKLREYFYFNIDAKPKVKTIINTVINKIS